MTNPLYERVFRAVANLDTFADGPNDDRFCPFDCGWEEYSNEKHADSCPIVVSRRLLAERIDTDPARVDA